MAVGLATTTLANKWLDALRGTPFSASATWVALHTADPGSAGTTAASAGSTSRSQATFSAASSGAIALTGTNPSWVNGGTSETLTHVSVWDASSSGNLLWTAALSSSTAWVSGETFVLTSCGLSLTPLAS